MIVLRESPNTTLACSVLKRVVGLKECWSRGQCLETKYGICSAKFFTWAELRKYHLKDKEASWKSEDGWMSKCKRCCDSRCEHRLVEKVCWTKMSFAPEGMNRNIQTTNPKKITSLRVIPTVTLYKLSDISFDSYCYVILVLYSDILCDKKTGEDEEERKTLMKSRARRFHQSFPLLLVPSPRELPSGVGSAGPGPAEKITRVILSSSSLLPVGAERWPLWYLLANLLTYLLSLILAYLSDILSDILYDILSDIPSAILFDILSEIFSDISSDIISSIASDIPSGVLSVISSDILSDILFVISFDISSDTFSDISSGRFVWVSAVAVPVDGFLSATAWLKLDTHYAWFETISDVSRRLGVSRRPGVSRRLDACKLRFERYKSVWLS